MSRRCWTCNSEHDRCVNGWMLVDRHTHRIARVPKDVANAQRFVMQAEGIWAMYCPQRGPDSLIYAASWAWVLEALGRGTACPHDALLHGRTREDA